jgi:hypothetical protein
MRCGGFGQGHGVCSANGYGVLGACRLTRLAYCERITRYTEVIRPGRMVSRLPTNWTEFEKIHLLMTCCAKLWVTEWTTIDYVSQMTGMVEIERGSKSFNIAGICPLCDT